ncbi:hypothetical protein [Cysteiniphilum litorale]|uniref:hypothetical protein n=1 Tax=Cysteiniphilum litorale TaxID=2056700 RepID=UPI003F8838C7
MKPFRQYRKLLAAALFAMTCQSALAQASATKPETVDSLRLYSEVTSLTMAFNAKYGKPFSLPTNAQAAINQIANNSDTKRYMDTKDYNNFAKDSQFAKDANAMMSDLTNLIANFKKIGFIHAIEAEGKTPAIMFDIDNTIELTSFDDDYFTKSGINDPATAEFIEQNCFKDGIACYFITARSCNHNESSATRSWLKKHLHLSDKTLDQYVFLSGSVPADACTSNANERVAYKDVLRRALSDQRHVYWLMSVGDQMTDWFGKDTGLKVWYPNAMFDSSIVENNHNNANAKLHLQSVTAPNNQCYNKLKKDVLAQSTLQYCVAFKNDHFVKSA